MIKTTFKILAGILLLFVLYVGIALLHGTITDYQPPKKETLEPAQMAARSMISDSVLSFAIWNLGYGGLGKESDFFFDSGQSMVSGGRMVRATRPLVEKNIAGFSQFAKSTKADFFLFQEVDFQSKRSYFIDQFDVVREQLPEFSAYRSTNYRVARVPLPVLEPWHVYGKIWSGLGSFAAYQPEQTERLQLPGSFSWPTRIFQLDRCIAYQKFAVKGGKTLIVLNVHNSAYDAKGDLKAQQMEYLKELVLREYEKGHYVVVGGDWNMCPPYFQFDQFMPGQTAGYSQFNIPADFLPEGWQWVYDSTIPTNRKNRDPFVAGETFITLIDFFLISPNVKVRSVKGIDQGFEYSDHQPVWMEVELVDFQ